MLIDYGLSQISLNHLFLSFWASFQTSTNGQNNAVYEKNTQIVVLHLGLKNKCRILVLGFWELYKKITYVIYFR